MPKPETLHENEINQLLWDFEIQADHLIKARYSDPAIVKKKKVKRK